MRRNKSLSIEDYISIRIEQLSEDRDKANKEYDKMWYNKMIQELIWIQQVTIGKEK